MRERSLAWAPVGTRVVVRRTVELGAAGLGDGLHGDAGAAELGRVVRSLDLDLRHELVVRDVHHAAVVADVAQVGAVHRHAEVLGACAVDREAVASAAEAGADADLLERRLVGRDDARQDAQQLGRVAADDRHLLDRIGRDQALAGAGLRLDDCAIGRDLDGLADLSDLELDVDAHRVVGAQAQALGLVGLESGESDPAGVTARVDGGEEEAAGGVAHALARVLRAFVDESNGRTRNDSSRAVSDVATEAAGRLGERRGRERSDRERQPESREKSSQRATSEVSCDELETVSARAP